MHKDPDSIKEQIFELITHRGRNNPILSRDIEARLEISGPLVREMVRVLRRAGEPIVAGEKGYFMAKNVGEVDLIVKDLQSRINSMAGTLSAIKRKAYERFGYQEQFDFTSNGAQVPKDAPGSTAGAYQHREEKGTGRSLFSVPADSQKRASESPGQRGVVSGVGKGFSLDDLL